MNNWQIEPGEGLAVRKKEKAKKPSMYNVFLLNDDYTTMDFVVSILENIFHKPRIEAVQIMLHVHKNGRGLAGIYTKDIAETKITNVHALARKNQFPLQCLMEKK